MHTKYDNKGEEVLAREIVIRDLLHKNYREVKTICEDILKIINDVDCGAGDVDDKSEEHIHQVSANKAEIAKVYAEKEHTIQERSTGAIYSVTQVPVSPVVPPTSVAHLFSSLKEQVADVISIKIGGKLDKVLEEMSSMNTEIRDGSLRVEKAIEKLVAFIAAFVSSTTQPPPQ
ncbi:hypothetical protein J3Q64DRAFT_1842435 [Phycomyces blakesleeanus]|uniref:Uncharacterized protein n=1 Tax=Phycomyces blakesleeanus TaxID=4837 RepID=A0ABR3AGZ8_PHYBL